jgi:hypothetical protein
MGDQQLVRAQRLAGERCVLHRLKKCVGTVSAVGSQPQHLWPQRGQDAGIAIIGEQRSGVHGFEVAAKVGQRSLAGLAAHAENEPARVGLRQGRCARVHGHRVAHLHVCDAGPDQRPLCRGERERVLRNGLPAAKRCARGRLSGPNRAIAELLDALEFSALNVDRSAQQHRWHHPHADPAEPVPHALHHCSRRHQTSRVS